MDKRPEAVRLATLPCPLSRRWLSHTGVESTFIPSGMPSVLSARLASFAPWESFLYGNDRRASWVGEDARKPRFWQHPSQERGTTSLHLGKTTKRLWSLRLMLHEAWGRLRSDTPQHHRGPASSRQPSLHREPPALVVFFPRAAPPTGPPGL